MYIHVYICIYIYMYRYAYVYIHREKERERERERERDVYDMFVYTRYTPSPQDECDDGVAAALKGGREG